MLQQKLLQQQQQYQQHQQHAMQAGSPSFIAVHSASPALPTSTIPSRTQQEGTQQQASQVTVPAAQVVL